MFVLKYYDFKFFISWRWGKLVVYQNVALVTGETKKLQKNCRGKWKVSTNQGICSKHFIENDFITTSLDTNRDEKR